MIEINLNDYCWVQLTDVGKKELKKQHDDLNIKFNNIIGEYIPKDEDADGWSKWQVHEIMNKLGHLLTNGFNVPFNPNIRIDA